MIDLGARVGKEVSNYVEEFNVSPVVPQSYYHYVVRISYGQQYSLPSELLDILDDIDTKPGQTRSFKDSAKTSAIEEYLNYTQYE